jgi:hypothetical protein
VFAGEMFPWFTGLTEVMPLCHRVAVPLQDDGGVRYSMPMELLPRPSQASLAEMSKLACGLKSANY